jgi:hypothetical protein
MAELVRLGQVVIQNALQWVDAYRAWSSDSRPADKRREYSGRYVFHIDQQLLIANRRLRIMRT